MRAFYRLFFLGLLLVGSFLLSVRPAAAAFYQGPCQNPSYVVGVTDNGAVACALTYGFLSSPPWTFLNNVDCRAYPAWCSESVARFAHFYYRSSCSGDWDPVTYECLEPCPSGASRDADGLCQCPEGQEESGGACVYKCASPSYWNGLSCSCPGDGVPVAGGCEFTCTGSQVLNPQTYLCEDSDYCPSGQEWVDAINGCAAPCIGGQIRVPNGVCVCESPKQWSVANQQCELQECPGNQIQGIQGCKCPDNTIWNAATQYCEPGCKDGEVVDLLGLCQCVSDVCCEAGRHYDSVIGECVKGCSSEKGEIEVLGRCACPAGQTKNEAGYCVDEPKEECPTGYTLADGVCVKDEDPPDDDDDDDDKCPAGQTWNGQACVDEPECPDGYELVDGRCEKPKECPDGYDLVDGMCEKPRECPDGAVLVGDVCELDKDCPEGFTMSGGVCQQDPDDDDECPIGSTRVGDVCEKDAECPEGSTEQADGSCTKDAECEDGASLVNGKCEFDGDCPDGASEEDGKCVGEVICPEGTEKDGDECKASGTQDCGAFKTWNGTQCVDDKLGGSLIGPSPAWPEFKDAEIAESFEAFFNELQKIPLVDDVSQMQRCIMRGSGQLGCPFGISIPLFGKSLSMGEYCGLWQDVVSTIGSLFLGLWTLLAVRIVLSA